MSRTDYTIGTIARAIKDLKVRKLKSVWVPFELTKKQMEDRVKYCKENLSRFNDGESGDVDLIVTGDETWMSFKTIYRGNKRMWVFEEEDYPRLPKLKPTVKKRMYCVFFNNRGKTSLIKVSFYSILIVPQSLRRSSGNIR